MRRLIKRRKFSFKKRNIFVIVLLLILFNTFLTFNVIKKEVTPILVNYTESEITKLVTFIIKDAIKKHISKEEIMNDIIKPLYNDSGNISSLDFNTSKINMTIQLLTSSIESDLVNLENSSIDTKFKSILKNDKIIYYVPIGVITKNPILSNLGPKIPIRINLVGDIVSEVKTEITDYGINNSLIKIFVNININEEVIFPFISKKVNVEENLLLGMKIIQGNIPQFYGTIYTNGNPLLNS